MALKLKTAPATSLITLAEAKQHCRVDHADDDALIQTYIDAAISEIDGHRGVLGRALINQEWELTYDDFPCGPLLIPLGPLVSVASVEYVDEATGIYTVWPSSNYVVDTNSYEGWISPVEAWPVARATLNAMRVTFVAGHGATAASVPAAIRVAALTLISHWYNNRESASEGSARMISVSVPMMFEDLVRTFKRPII